MSSFIALSTCGGSEIYLSSICKSSYNRPAELSTRAYWSILSRKAADIRQLTTHRSISGGRAGKANAAQANSPTRRVYHPHTLQNKRGQSLNVPQLSVSPIGRIS